jgi:enoyl-CoA hydratase/carnithine racemase
VLELQRDGALFVIRMTVGENRFTLKFIRELNRLLDQVQAEASGGGALLIASQGKYWSNGIDLDWLTAAPAADQAAFVGELDRVMGRLIRFEVPTVGVLNGHTFAGGALLATCLDYRVMRADRGWFCFPEVDIGIPFSPGMQALLKCKLSPRVLRDAELTGRRYTGPEALEAGLVDGLAAEEELLQVAAAMAEPLAKKGRGIYAALKAGLYGETARALGYNP